MNREPSHATTRQPRPAVPMWAVRPSSGPENRPSGPDYSRRTRE